MSFFKQNLLTSLSTRYDFDEDDWVRQIRQTLDEELEEEAQVPVSIFSTPKPLMVTDPDSYIPQMVAVGPFHHLRTELYDMERYKVSAAKRQQKELPEDLKINDFVDHLMKHELRIRACYHRPLNYNGETLAWMVAIDAAFLFEFFQVCGMQEKKFQPDEPMKFPHLIELSGNNTACNEILKDITKLENQIPLFVLRMLLELRYSSLASADKVLSKILFGISKELSPFKMVDRSNRRIEIKECAHLLEFLYRYIAPEVDPPSNDLTVEINHEDGDDNQESVAASSKTATSPDERFYVRILADHLWKVVKSLHIGRRIMKPIKVLIKLPWMVMSRIPLLRVLKVPIEHLFRAFTAKDKKEDKENNRDNDGGDGDEKSPPPPLLEEIAIPSVTQLSDVGVDFAPTNLGIKGIEFDPKTLTLTMPVIALDVNSEVVLRNLVAYEVCTAAAAPLFLTRYTEFMNGIIDTEGDVAILCRKGIIINHLKSEKEVAELWNGMSKSIRLTKVAALDRAIAEVNRYYGGRFRVKCKKVMDKYVFGSWRILTFLATVAVLLLMTLQSFCQVYTCGKLLHIAALDSHGGGD
ncbi:putative UPF0481 protein At3g02645 [Andrographis paniculata]|uniref:putative UPF0481 protein At3g02645 n=1 Tax=Andrographis paniculata TaxID=175694 RepID=UPI0021E97726|nr:putative UPF0481 protein At3g02645 [Andrographis paniculata]